MPLDTTPATRPASILDVAALILDLSDGGLSTMKLQKLCYFAYAWSLALHNDPVCPAVFEAWSSGPVCRTLYNEHHGEHEVAALPTGDPTRVSPAGRDLVVTLLNSYGRFTGPQLSAMSRAGGPWEHATGGWPVTADTPKNAMNEFRIRQQFTNLWARREVRFPQPH